MSAYKIYGWIPNIEGDVCRPSRVISKIDGVNNLRAKEPESYRKEYNNSYERDYLGKKITVSRASYGEIEITICDRGGLCLLEFTKTEKKKILILNFGS